MQYDGDLKLPTNYLVPPPAIHGVSGEYCAATGIKTFVCSETQKFGRAWGGFHVRQSDVVELVSGGTLCSFVLCWCIAQYTTYAQKHMKLHVIFSTDVTFFWNGNRSGYFNEDLETYVEVWLHPAGVVTVHCTFVALFETCLLCWLRCVCVSWAFKPS